MEQNQTLVPGKDLIFQTKLSFSGAYVAEPIDVRTFGFVASDGTGNWISTLVAVLYQKNIELVHNSEHVGCFHMQIPWSNKKLRTNQDLPQPVPHLPKKAKEKKEEDKMMAIYRRLFEDKQLLFHYSIMRSWLT